MELDQWAVEQAAGAGQPPRRCQNQVRGEGWWLVGVWIWISGLRSKRRGRHRLQYNRLCLVGGLRALDSPPPSPLTPQASFP